MTQENKKLTFATIEALEQHLEQLNEGNTFASIPEDIIEATNSLNAQLVKDEAKCYIFDNPQDFYKAIFLLKCTSAKQCREGIVVEQVKLTLTEGNKIEATRGTKPLTFADFYNAKLSLIVNTHADNTKATQKDRIEANAYFYGVNGFGIMQCLIASATSQQKLEGTTLKWSTDMRATMKVVEALYQAMGKENPFLGGASGNKKKERLTLAVNNFIGVFEGWQVNKYHFDAFAQSVASLRRGVFTIDNVQNAVNSLAMVVRHAYNKIEIETKDRAKIIATDKDEAKAKKQK